MAFALEDQHCGKCDHPIKHGELCYGGYVEAPLCAQCRDEEWLASRPERAITKLPRRENKGGF